MSPPVLSCLSGIASITIVPSSCLCTTRDSDCTMASQHAAALGAGAACVGAALAAKVAVLGLVQILSVALEDDQTEAEWATNRSNRLRLRSRQLRQQRRRNRRQAYAPPLPYIRFKWTLAMMSEEWIKKRMRFATTELDRILPLLRLIS